MMNLRETITLAAAGAFAILFAGRDPKPHEPPPEGSLQNPISTGQSSAQEGVCQLHAIERAEKELKNQKNSGLTTLYLSCVVGCKNVVYECGSDLHGGAMCAEVNGAPAPKL